MKGVVRRCIAALRGTIEHTQTYVRTFPTPEAINEKVVELRQEARELEMDIGVSDGVWKYFFNDSMYICDKVLSDRVKAIRDAFGIPASLPADTLTRFVHALSRTQWDRADVFNSVDKDTIGEIIRGVSNIDVNDDNVGKLFDLCAHTLWVCWLLTLNGDAKRVGLFASVFSKDEPLELSEGEEPWKPRVSRYGAGTYAGFPTQSEIETKFKSIISKSIKGLRVGLKGHMDRPAVNKLIRRVFDECLAAANASLGALEAKFISLMGVRHGDPMEKDARECTRVVLMYTHALDGQKFFDQKTTSEKVFKGIWGTGDGFRGNDIERAKDRLKRTCELAAEVCWLLVIADVVEDVFDKLGPNVFDGFEGSVFPTPRIVEKRIQVLREIVAETSGGVIYVDQSTLKQITAESIEICHDIIKERCQEVLKALSLPVIDPPPKHLELFVFAITRRQWDNEKELIEPEHEWNRSRALGALGVHVKDVFIHTLWLCWLFVLNRDEDRINSYGALFFGEYPRLSEAKGDREDEFFLAARATTPPPGFPKQEEIQKRMESVFLDLRAASDSKELEDQISTASAALVKDRLKAMETKLNASLLVHYAWNSPLDKMTTTCVRLLAQLAWNKPEVFDPAITGQQVQEAVATGWEQVDAGVLKNTCVKSVEIHWLMGLEPNGK